MSSPKKIALLIDGNALIHRVWHTLPPMHDPKGRLVNAVYGFSSILMKLLPTVHPDYFVVCWDTPEPTYRHVNQPNYKAQRIEQPQEFYDQIPMTQEIIIAMGGKNCELPGYEADDLLATLAKNFESQQLDVTILTSDRDIWQLISPNVKVMSFKKGVTDTIIYNEASLKEITGLTPSQIVDFKAMRGDASDNLKGIPGIGEKTATELLLQFSDLEGVLRAAKDQNSVMKDSVRRKLLDGERAARETYPLVLLQIHAPISKELQDWKREDVDQERVKETLLRYGFQSLAARLGKVETNEKVHKKQLLKKEDTFHRIIVTDVDQALDLIALVQQRQVVLREVFSDQSSLLQENSGMIFAFGNTAVFLSLTVLNDVHVSLAVRELLSDPMIPKIGHTIKSFLHWAKRFDWEVRGIAFDTEIAVYLLSAGEGGTDISSLAASRFGTLIGEGLQGCFDEVEMIFRLFSILRDELREQHIESIFERFELPLIPILMQMEERGILVDHAYLLSLQNEFRMMKHALEKAMHEMVEEDFNPSSTQQLAHILFDVLQLPTKGIKKGKTGLSTAASELEKLEGMHPIIEKILEYREVSKLLSTYVETLPGQCDAEGRVHTTYDQTVAATGRLSSRDPNLQNIPIRTEAGRKIRRSFIASPGMVLLSCDYSQIQLRIVAAMANDEKMLRAFQNNLDIHTATAAEIWGIPMEEVTREQRSAAKTINFGVLYGQGANGLAKQAGISFTEAKDFIQRYFSVYSGVREYLDQTKVFVHEQKFVKTLFGRKRIITEIDSPLPFVRAAAERMAMNMPIQGTEADIMKLALIAVARALPVISERSFLLLQVHDELVLEVPKKEVVQVAKRVMEIMEGVAVIGCPIVVEAKFGENWEDMEKIVL
ncbi:DNA polymerase I [Candidatus Uhrbacteria bacterium]|nr:DNA polymerase I [Candidatus Uhrbacteria bacterium]